MRVVERIEELRAECERARRDDRGVGLVPTMGSFHEGHRLLMRTARSENDLVVVTLFVNPLQFGPTEDLDTYPRDLEGDLHVAELEGVDVVFTPRVEEMYRHGARTTVHVAELTDGMCGESRPTHFDGVATVVAKLFAIVGACRAYFGRKDAQQLAVIRRMSRDLDFDVEVVGCPLVREPDGLAMSSRNAHLSPADRTAATVLHRALADAGERLEAGARDPRRICAGIVETIATEPRVELEYAEVRVGPDLTTVPDLRDGVHDEILVAVAAKVGTTRVIDNMTVSLVDGVRFDLGVTVERHS